MLRRPARRLIWTFAAVALTAALGAAATAAPGGGPRALTPTPSLGPDGAVEPPVPADSTGGVEAPEQPAEQPASIPEPVGEQLPPPVATDPSEPAPAAPPGTTAPQPEPVAETVPVEPEPVEAPTETEALEGGAEPLVPVVMLSAPVAAAEDSEPLIDMSPEKLDAPPLGEAAQSEDEDEDEDDEVIIPVPPEDIDQDGDQQDDEDDAVQTPDRQPAADGLALTGRPLAAFVGAGLLLLVFGVALRLSTAAPARA